MHSFGLTVIFFIESKNCAELSIEYGELAVKGLKKPCSHFTRLWQGESIRETIIRRWHPSLCTFARPYARAIDVSLGEICLASDLFPDKTVDRFIDRRYLFGCRVTLEGRIRGLIRQLLLTSAWRLHPKL